MGLDGYRVLSRVQKRTEGSSKSDENNKITGVRSRSSISRKHARTLELPKLADNICTCVGAIYNLFRITASRKPTLKCLTRRPIVRGSPHVSQPSVS